ncbi:MAG TPA: mechanosensitive ion channel domain-containing protein, partial [Thermohalobaculum sp.]|nr:mechanosensitive ion channel domain-containing protein [Thermohalobaculum sp.]
MIGHAHIHPARVGVFVAIVLTVLAAGPAWAQEDQPEPAEPSIAVESEPTGDDAIARRIRAIYREIPAMEGVRLSVDSGVVTLTGTILERETAEEAVRLANRVEGVATVENALEIETSVSGRLGPAAERLLARGSGAIQLLPLVATALLLAGPLAFAGFRIARLSWPWDRIAPNAFIADLLRQVVRLVFVAVGAVIALDLLGATALIGTVLGAAGIIGLAIGFAVRDTIENYIASIMLSLRQPFQPNDHVVIEGYEGFVIRLTSRATIIMTLEGNHVRIPNAVVFKAAITNYTRNPERRFDFRLGVNADANLADAVETGLRALRDLPFVLRDPEPLGWIDAVGDSSVILWFGGWIDQRSTDFARARSEAIRLVKRALEEAGFELPEPIYRLRLQDPAASLPEALPA